MNNNFNYIMLQLPALKLHRGKGLIKHAAILLTLVCFSFTLIAQPNITRVEYYVDADPGYGHGTTVTIVPSNDISNASFNVNFSALANGVHIVGVRSKDVNGAWSIDNKWLFLKAYAAGKMAVVPKINRVEYYIDTDPGYGNATALPVVRGTNLSNLPINIDMTPLTKGLHLVGVRSQDTTGAWSLDNKWVFVNPYSGSGAAPLPNITGVEYYIDADPGYGNGIPLSIVPGNDLSNLALNINLAPLSAGVHVVGLRSLDANGAWSLDNKWIFLKPYHGGKAAVLPKITRVEYFVDTDPGYGNATALSIVPATSLSNLAININMAPLSQGVHIIGVRSQDSLGAWSLDNHWVFLNKYTASVPQPNITNVEYYVDADPGYGQATPVTIVPGQDLSAISFPVTLTGLSTGGHIIGIRSKDANGAWSLDNEYAITYSPHAGAILEVYKITQESLVNSLRLQFNPVHQQAVVIYTVAKDDKTVIRVIDNLGRVVLAKETQVFAGVNLVTLETANLAQGIYTIQAISLKDHQTVRMMKE